MKGVDDVDRPADLKRIAAAIRGAPNCKYQCFVLATLRNLSIQRNKSR